MATCGATWCTLAGVARPPRPPYDGMPTTFSDLEGRRGGSPASEARGGEGLATLLETRDPCCAVLLLLGDTQVALVGQAWKGPYEWVLLHADLLSLLP